MQALRVIRGDAPSPQAKGSKIIAHVCNDLGGWGKGFVLAISKRWPEPERAYRGCIASEPAPTSVSVPPN